MAKEYLTMPIKMFMMANGNMIKELALENSKTIKINFFIKVIGLTIRKMVLG